MHHSLETFCFGCQVPIKCCLCLIRAVNFVCCTFVACLCDARRVQKTSSCLTSASAAMGTIQFYAFSVEKRKSFPTLASRSIDPKSNCRGVIEKKTLSAPIIVLFCRGDNPNTWQSINHNPDRKTCNNRKQRVWFGMVSRSITRKIRARKFNPTSVESVGSVKNHNMCLSQCAAENHDKSKHPLPSWNHLKPPAPPHPIRNVPHCGTNDNYIWPKLRRGCHRFELSSLILMDTA